MPSGPTSMKELAALGLDYGYMFGSAKYLRPTGLMTVHPKGGGATAHWTARDYLLLTTSLAGDLPSDAPTVAPALAQIPHVATVRKKIFPEVVLEQEGPAGFTYGEWFEHELTQTSGLTGEALQREVDATRGATITMSLFPYRVEVMFRGFGEKADETRTLTFQAPAPPLAEGQNRLFRPDLVHKTPLWRERTTVIPYGIVFACASLLAKVPASVKAVPPSGAGVTTALPEREAPEPHHKAPAPVRENQPLAATGPSDSLERMDFGVFAQSHSIACTRHPFLNQNDVLQHAQVAQL